MTRFECGDLGRTDQAGQVDEVAVHIGERPVSVLFADPVGFTERSLGVDPAPSQVLDPVSRLIGSRMMPAGGASRRGQNTRTWSAWTVHADRKSVV